MAFIENCSKHVLCQRVNYNDNFSTVKQFLKTIVFAVQCLKYTDSLI